MNAPQTVNDHLSQLQAQIEERDSQHQQLVATLRRQLADLSSFRNVLLSAEQADAFRDAAAKRDITVAEWVVEALNNALEVQPRIKISRKIFTWLERLAGIRGITIDRLTTGDAMTKCFERAKGNRAI